MHAAGPAEFATPINAAASNTAIVTPSINKTVSPFLRPGSEDGTAMIARRHLRKQTLMRDDGRIESL
jgi:hypothetical protein